MGLNGMATMAGESTLLMHILEYDIRSRFHRTLYWATVTKYPSEPFSSPGFTPIFLLLVKFSPFLPPSLSPVTLTSLPLSRMLQKSLLSFFLFSRISIPVFNKSGIDAMHFFR